LPKSLLGGVRCHPRHASAEPRSPPGLSLGQAAPVAAERRHSQIQKHYWWTGRKHSELYPQLVDILKNVWGCRKIVVDATGVGQPVSSFLRKSLGSKVRPFTFTTQSKSKLGFNLLAAINSGRLKMYRGEGTAEEREFWFEMERAKSQYRPSQTMNFYVDPSQGHDDFLMSLALLVEASSQYSPRSAKGTQ